MRRERANGFPILLKPCDKYSANQSAQILRRKNLYWYTGPGLKLNVSKEGTVTHFVPYTIGQLQYSASYS